MFKENSMYNEKLLIEQLVKGNKKAFTVIYKFYRNDVYGYSISMLKTNELAEEIVQDVFLNIWKHRDRLNPDLSFKSFVFTTTRNLTLNLISKVANNRKLKEAVFYSSQKAYSTTDNKIIQADYESLKNQAIELLPPKCRIIFELSRNEDMSYKEISEKLNISLSTVKGQTSKALAIIRDFLQTQGDVAILYIIFFFLV
jgi:RNA polymerase sigma-70 factor (ECF subfamily)